MYEIPMSINWLTIVNQAVEQKMFSTNIAASNSDCTFTFICLFSGFFPVRYRHLLRFAVIVSENCARFVFFRVADLR